MMLVEWNFKSEYTDTWITRCEELKVSPNAVYEARPHETWDDVVRIITGKGLRLMTVTTRHVRVLKYKTPNKQFKDYL